MKGSKIVKKQSLFVRIIIILFSLIFCLVAFSTTLTGMLLGSVRGMISAENLAEMIGEFGGVLNAITGNEKHAEKSLSQLTLEKLDDETVEKYNLTEDNLDKIYELDNFKTYVSSKMENAMMAAAEGGTFEMTNTEIVDVLRQSETEFAEITGITMSEENYTELEIAVANAGYEEYSYDFSQMGISEGFSLIQTIFSIRLDLVMYGVTLVVFLFVLLLNRRYKSCTLLYAGGVVLLCGIIFGQLNAIKSILWGMLDSDVERTLEPIVNLLINATRTIGKNAVIIGCVLLGVYTVLLACQIVKRFVLKKK